SGGGMDIASGQRREDDGPNRQRDGGKMMVVAVRLGDHDGARKVIVAWKRVGTEQRKIMHRAGYWASSRWITRVSTFWHESYLVRTKEKKSK
ncbi:hypothetical protein U1Q18_003806, partial [Sarracenia purpurea var. burkii]